MLLLFRKKFTLILKLKFDFETEFIIPGHCATNRSKRDIDTYYTNFCTLRFQVAQTTIPSKIVIAPEKTTPGKFIGNTNSLGKTVQYRTFTFLLFKVFPKKKGCPNFSYSS